MNPHNQGGRLLSVERDQLVFVQYYRCIHIRLSGAGRTPQHPCTQVRQRVINSGVICLAETPVIMVTDQP